ncbi:hypothetical protein ACET3Z_030269 [Daucus carota]
MIVFWISYSVSQGFKSRVYGLELSLEGFKSRVYGLELSLEEILLALAVSAERISKTPSAVTTCRKLPVAAFYIQSSEGEQKVTLQHQQRLLCTTCQSRMEPNWRIEEHAFRTS